MTWLILVGVLVLIVVAALRKDPGTAFPPNSRRRNLKRGTVNVARPADDPYPYAPVIVDPDSRYDTWTAHTSSEDSDCGPVDSTPSWGGHDSGCDPEPDDSGSGSSDDCSDSSTSD